MTATFEGGGRPDLPQSPLAAEYATARVLVESARLLDAAPRVLEAICSTLGWEHGAFWTVDIVASGVPRVEINAAQIN